MRNYTVHPDMEYSYFRGTYRELNVKFTTIAVDYVV